MVMIYKTKKEYYESVKYRLRQFSSGLWGLLFHCLIMGVISLLVYIMNAVKAFFLRERVAGAVIAALFMVMLFGWMVTFVSGRAKAVKYECIADSLSYELSKFTQAYGEGDKVIIGTDTITIPYNQNNEK